MEILNQNKLMNKKYPRVYSNVYIASWKWDWEKVDSKIKRLKFVGLIQSLVHYYAGKERSNIKTFAWLKDQSWEWYPSLAKENPKITEKPRMYLAKQRPQENLPWASEPVESFIKPLKKEALNIWLA